MKTDNPQGGKQSQYLALVARRKQCTLCADVCNPARVASGDFDQRPHIGPWTDWQGNLDADVMVLGQEWGGTTNYQSQEGQDSDADSTNKNLRSLLDGVGIQVGPPSTIQGSESSGSLFFTNAVLCLRKGDATGGGNTPSKKTFRTCSENFLLGQIQLIQPRVILVLGKLTWLGLMHACKLPIMRTGTLKALVEGEPVSIPKTKTVAVPLFHCGSKSRINRPEQHLDWKRHRDLIDPV